MSRRLGGLAGFALLAVLVACSAALILLLGDWDDGTTRPSEVARAGADVPQGPAPRARTGALGDAPRDDAAATTPTRAPHRVESAPEATVRGAASAHDDGSSPRARIAWPVTTRTGHGGTAPPAAGEGAITRELAFCALQYVGVDPAAEATWRRAIDDPRLPAGLRSDLIEDLNQEGYADNGRPTKADLPLILARIELIERLAPHATDPVNAAAFAEAYKDLLAMYERLGGEPRAPR